MVTSGFLSQKSNYAETYHDGIMVSADVIIRVLLSYGIVSRGPETISRIISPYVYPN